MPSRLREWQELPLSIPPDQRVLRLQRLDRRDLLDRPQLPDAEVRDADLAHQALLLELGERRPCLLDVLRRDRPVDLVEVDRVNAKVASGWRPPQDRAALEAVRDGAARALEPATEFTVNR